MKQKAVFIGAGLMILLFLKVYPQQENFPILKGPYLGQKPPGMTPTLFAPHLLPSSSFHTSPTFMPDGRETYWKMQGTSTISMMKTAGDLWTAPAEISLSSLLIDFRDPMISPDGKRMFFLSKGKLPFQSEEKENIWCVDRKGDGWSEPQPLNERINSHRIHWQVSSASNKNLYFTSRNTGIEDIYCSGYRHGEYQDPERLENTINTENMCETTPYVSPDESFLIFSRWDPKDSGPSIRAFVSFRTKNGHWDMPRKLDFLGYALCPQVTSDGRYLFFIGDGFVIKWVSAKVIEELRPKG